ncbi:hypothetical protein HMPREF0058_1064, partial [Actinomyces urogenitalis DSM 15434]
GATSEPRAVAASSRPEAVPVSGAASAEVAPAGAAWLVVCAALVPASEGVVSVLIPVPILP